MGKQGDCTLCYATNIARETIELLHELAIIA